MRTWLWLLGGLIVWTVHFFTLYIIGSIFLSTPVARVGVILITLACLAVNGAILFLARPTGRSQQDGFAHWVRSLAVMSAGVSVIAVIWQGLPALLS